MLRPVLAPLLAISFLLQAHASAPATLGYQGRLTDAGGQPISATLSITFRLDDVACHPRDKHFRE